METITVDDDEDCKKVLSWLTKDDCISGKPVAISVELVGPNASGRALSMNGSDVTSYAGQVHHLFETVAAQYSKIIATVSFVHFSLVRCVPLTHLRVDWYR